MKPQIKIGQVWKFKESYGSDKDYYFVVNRITEQVIGFQYLDKDSTGWCFDLHFHQQYELVSDV